MPIEHQSNPAHPHGPTHQLNIHPPLHPREGASLEALGRLALDLPRFGGRVGT